MPVVHDLPGVGQNLRDHPLLPVTWSSKPEYFLDPVGPRIQFGLRYTATGSSVENDMILYMNTFATTRVDRGGNRMEPIGVRNIIGLELAEGSGDLRLNSADAHDQPILNYNYFQEEFDRSRVRDGIRMCVKLGEHEAWKDIIESRIDPPDEALESDEALEAWMMREVTTGHHISCTNKMGPASDPMAVVDQYGKVHGLQGLRVVDASIMPDCVRANINVTTMMIGEHIADFIANGK